MAGKKENYHCSRVGFHMSLAQQLGVSSDCVKDLLIKQYLFWHVIFLLLITQRCLECKFDILSTSINNIIKPSVDDKSKCDRRGNKYIISIYQSHSAVEGDMSRREVWTLIQWINSRKSADGDIVIFLHAEAWIQRVFQINMS